MTKVMTRPKSQAERALYCAFGFVCCILGEGRSSKFQSLHQCFPLAIILSHPGNEHNSRFCKIETKKSIWCTKCNMSENPPLREQFKVVQMMMMSDQGKVWKLYITLSHWLTPRPDNSLPSKSCLLLPRCPRKYGYMKRPSMRPERATWALRWNHLLASRWDAY